MHLPDKRMQGLRLKFGDRRNDWKCCFCCHVRTGTIFIGIWHLILHVIVLSVMVVMLRDPELFEQDLDPVLPTPLSEVDNINIREENTRTLGIYMHDESSFVSPQPPLPHSYNVWESRTFSPQNMNVGIVVTFCTFVMTLLLLYGAVKGKPSYLMPFFCLKVFDFCITSLSAVGYLYCPPDLNRFVAQNNLIPFKEELLRLNPQTLSLFAAMGFLVVMTAKAYFIGVVWSCYKFLALRQVSAQRTVQFIDPDVQNLLPDLPDYETAVKKYPTPPPSYASAMLGQYPVVVDVNNIIANTAQPLSAQNIVVPPAVIAGAANQSHPSGQVSNPQQV